MRTSDYSCTQNGQCHPGQEDCAFCGTGSVCCARSSLTDGPKCAAAAAEIESERKFQNFKTRRLESYCTKPVNAGRPLSILRSLCYLPFFQATRIGQLSDLTSIVRRNARVVVNVKLAAVSRGRRRKGHYAARVIGITPQGALTTSPMLLTFATSQTSIVASSQSRRVSSYIA